MGEQGKPTKVSDPIVRALMALAVALSTWALSQVQEHGKALAAIISQVNHLEMSVGDVEKRSVHVTDDLHRDIREIRALLDKKL